MRVNHTVIPYSTWCKWEWFAFASCLMCARGLCRSRSKGFLYVVWCQCLSMLLPCLYPLSILYVHLIYPLWH